MQLMTRAMKYVDDHLVVTGSWAIYARSRTENFIIEDLRKQREKLEQHHSNGEPLPGVLKKLMRIGSDPVPLLRHAHHFRPLDLMGQNGNSICRKPTMTIRLKSCGS